MYKVQNVTPGNLPIDLEVGSKMLKSGEQFDLDAHCSRKWLRTNVLLRKLFAAGALRLVHDSEVKIPKAPIKKVTAVSAPLRSPAKKLPKPSGKVPTAKPAVVDLKDKESPTAKTYKKKKTVKKDEPEVVAEKAEDPVEKMLTKKPANRPYFRKSSKDEVEEQPKKTRTYTHKKSEDTKESKKKKTKKRKKYSKKSDE